MRAWGFPTMGPRGSNRTSLPQDLGQYPELRPPDSSSRADFRSPARTTSTAFDDVNKLYVGVWRGHSETLGLHMCWEHGRLRFFDSITES